ncbi:MBL fold metallo-hydrolase [Histophilus somni]|uniref:MBL fold metallo-hydrolase n=1 Tax=Histophilus somni TaxID=731 RepID=UPI00201EDCA2|nr:MBL fold metallo-hydrolase [Histophilus somni]
MNIEIVPVTAFQQNCSIIWDNNKSAAIVDPGGEATKLIKRIEELGLNLELILLTHGHIDHVGAALKLKQYFNVEIWGSNEKDDFLFNSLPQQSEQFGLLFETEVFKPDRWLNQEYEIVRIGEMNFEVLHLPGHTPGHVGFIEYSKKIAFTGDVLFQNSIGRTDFPRGNHAELIQSIRDKLWKLDDDMIIIAGHGNYTTIGKEKKYNPYIR